MTLRLVKPGEVHPQGEGDAWGEAFESFWKAYCALRPARTHPKGEAMREWDKVKDKSEESFRRVMQEFRACEAAWREAGTEWRYVPHARTWLHQRIVSGVFYGGEE